MSNETLDIKLIPLGRKADQFAEIEQSDFDFLIKLGVSPRWNVDAKGHPTVSASRASGARVTVARVLMDAGPGQMVKHTDGNPRNLRRGNLQLVEGGSAIRRDRALLTPENLRRRKRTAGVSNG
jgi:hypothetical protein